LNQLSADRIPATTDRKAAALVESIARNHGFIDGNKRTAFLLVDLLIHRSGYRYKNELTSNKSFVGLEELIVRIANDVHPPFEEIVDWFKENLEKA
jgi:death on curing protein